ncbi:MAG TPA: S41 family peptidase, partial [Candidatus Egerieimonas faecigallinarum]|nr:S41 family peptidase [Candidatus Egerieimonas faecigallinarum]
MEFEEQQEKKEKRGIHWKSFAGGAVCAVLLLAAAAAALWFTGDGPGSLKSAAKVAGISQIIDSVYMGEIDEQKLEDSMYAGLMAGLEDPYSRYYSREECEEEDRSNAGEYEGLGVVLGQMKDTGEVVIVQCYDGGSAAEAGVQAGDILYAVDGESVEGKELSEISDAIQEKEEKDVVLTLGRSQADGSEQRMDITVTKGPVEMNYVSGEMLGDGIGYLAITQFTGVTSEQFQETYQSLKDQGMERLIIDLRDNPGGLLDAVCETLRQILPEGMIVYMEDKAGNREEYTCDGETPIDIPLVVLVNENSASASEIFAGAVKDHGVGTLVGTTTFGKGIVQTYYRLGDGSEIKLTTAKYFTPNGNNIHGTGVEPDVQVEASEDGETDVQLEKAVEVVKEM